MAGCPGSCRSPRVWPPTPRCPGRPTGCRRRRRAGRGQIMADTLVERVTGQATADAVPVEVELVMTDATLLAGARRARAPGRAVGPVPAPMPATWSATPTRDGVAAPALHPTRRRRLVAMESRRRQFPDRLRRLLVLRDQVCRTPWCGAPIRHADHVVRRRRRADQRRQRPRPVRGLQLRQTAPGWRARPGPRGAGDLVRPPPRPATPTPADHRGYRVIAERHSATVAGRSRIEERFLRVLAAA